MKTRLCRFHSVVHSILTIGGLLASVVCGFATGEICTSCGAEVGVAPDDLRLPMAVAENQ